MPVTARVRAELVVMHKVSQGLKLQHPVYHRCTVINRATGDTQNSLIGAPAERGRPQTPTLWRLRIRPRECLHETEDFRVLANNLVFSGKLVGDETEFI